MTDKPELLLCPFDRAKWSGEPSHNPLKGWIINGYGNRITKLGNRNSLGKLIAEHNKEIDILKSRYITLENKCDDYKLRAPLGVTKAEAVPRATADKLAEALDQILDDGGYIVDWKEDDTPIFKLKEKPTGGCFCEAAAQQAIEALNEYNAAKGKTER